MHSLIVTLTLTLTLFSSPSTAHNITRILATHPDFSTFNHYLSATHLAAEINRRETITVLALSNSAMATVLDKHLSLTALKNLLSLHVLVDYFGARKLHQITAGSALASTLFQASGAAQGMSGFVNITDARGGHVTFATDTNTHSKVSFVKSIKEIPYNISVLEISAALPSASAEAPAPSPAEMNLTALMTKKGCRLFADLVAGTSEVEKMFTSNMDTGLTVFCPIDQAMKAFMPSFKNLTAGAKVDVLLYQALPVYMSMEMLKSGNGVVNTLATDGVKKGFNLTVQNDGEVVTLRSKVKARITGTVVDEDPLAVYTTDAVLEPREVFKKAVVVAAPAPAPAPAAEAPAKGKRKGRDVAPSPAGPDAEPSDQDVADDNGVGMARLSWSATVLAAAAAVVLV